jgi:Flp pilus assembly protein TadG
MSTLTRSRRKPNDRGAATVEAALALVAFVTFLGLTLCGITAAIDQVRCVDAAREAARLAARGEPEEGKKAAARIAPTNAKITIDAKGDHIEVNIQASPASGLLPDIRLHAEAFAVREPVGPAE